ncbi:MAG: hypothetical protein ACKVU2_17745 [Saprospiraceae bacterium]
MDTSLASFIIIDIIRERASSGEIAQACGDLTNNYYSQLATANTAYTINWGAGGGTSGQVKITVGGQTFMVEYDAGDEVVVVFGTCGSTDWDDFSVVGNTVLQYSDGTLSFDVEFELHNGNDLKIKATPASNTLIEVFD